MTKDNDNHSQTPPLDSTTTPISHSSLPPHPSPFTFTQIIDADHCTINRLASRIRKLPPLPPSPSPEQITTTLTQLKPLLLEVSARLIRHDCSENLVMRPAFIQILGPQGQEMADHDRTDHATARGHLLTILSKLSTLETSPDEDQDVSHADREMVLGDVLAQISATFDELGSHMAVESGEFLPYFESVVDRETSGRLAAEYSRTLVMGPYVTVSSSCDERCWQGDGRDLEKRAKRRPLFEGGIVEFVNCPLERMTALYKEVVADAERDEGNYLEAEVKKEIERLQVGKWLSLDQRKALRQGDDAGKQRGDEHGVTRKDKL